MKVRELIAALEKFDPDEPVHHECCGHYEHRIEHGPQMVDGKLVLR